MSRAARVTTQDTCHVTALTRGEDSTPRVKTATLSYPRRMSTNQTESAGAATAGAKVTTHFNTTITVFLLDILYYRTPIGAVQPVSVLQVSSNLCESDFLQIQQI